MCSLSPFKQFCNLSMSDYLISRNKNVDNIKFRHNFFSKNLFLQHLFWFVY